MWTINKFDKELKSLDNKVDHEGNVITKQDLDHKLDVVRIDEKIIHENWTK